MLSDVYSATQPWTGPVASTSRTWNVAFNETLSGYSVEHADGDRRLLISRGRHLYQYRPNEPLWHVTTLPLPTWQRVGLALDWHMHSFANVVPFSARTALLSFGAHVYAMHDGMARPLLGLVRPTAVHRGGCAICPDGVVYFGECNPNRSRGTVHIYRWDCSQAQVTVAYNFPRHSVRGINAVHLHPDDNSLWVCTGDLRGECRILRTDDGFRTLEVIGAGDESWRAASLQSVDGKICYATAGERLPNKVYRIDPVSGSREELGEVGGPVQSALGLRHDVIFAVRGGRCPCNPEGEAALWHLDSERGLQKVFKGNPSRGRRAPGGFHLVRAPGDGFWFSTLHASGKPLQTFCAYRRAVH